MQRAAPDLEPSEGAAPPSDPGRLRRAHVLKDSVLGAIVLGAAVLRFWAIGSRPLWFDEYITSLSVQVKFTDVLSTLWRLEGTPPLYFLLEWAWIRVVGRGDTAMRSSSAIVGTLTVVVVYALMIELRQSRRAARIAAAMVAVHPFLIWYSREARAYALFTFLSAAALWCLARAIERRRPVDYLLWSFVAAAAFATHYFGGFVVATQGVWLLASLWKERRWRDGLYAFAPITLAGIGTMAMAISQRSSNQDWINRYRVSHRLAEAGRSYLLGASPPADLLMLVAIPPLAYAVVAALRWTGRRERTLAVIMLAMAAAGFLVPLAVARPFFLGRNEITLIVVLAVPLAIGLAADRARFGRVAAGVLCALWLVTAVWVEVDPVLGKPNWKALVAAIDQEIETENAILVMTYQGMPVQRYGLPDSRIVATDETVPVTEIDLVIHLVDPPRCARWVGLTCDVVMWPRFPDHLKGQFKNIGRFKVDDFEVVRYQSAEPVRMRPCRLVADPDCIFVLRLNT